jgi:hypothetical protein
MGTEVRAAPSPLGGRVTATHCATGPRVVEADIRRFACARFRAATGRGPDIAPVVTPWRSTATPSATFRLEPLSSGRGRQTPLTASPPPAPGPRRPSSRSGASPPSERSCRSNGAICGRGSSSLGTSAWNTRLARSSRARSAPGLAAAWPGWLHSSDRAPLGWPVRRAASDEIRC